MDCRTARLLMDFVRPRALELEPSEVEALESHLADCPECAPLARAERQADELLGAAMRAVPLPGELRDRLLRRLDGDRKRWYRQWSIRHPRAAAAAAAAMLLCMGMAVYAAFRPRPPVDLVAVLDEMNDQRSRPPEEVERWFEAQGMRTIVPREFNYSFLASCAEEKFEGKYVPRLYFVRGQNYAFVYILSAAQFDLEAIRQQPPAGSGAFSLEVKSPPADKNFAYLVFYTGGSLEWLLDGKVGPST